MQHLDEGTIHAWLDGALPPDEAALAEAHVAACTACAAQVAEARGLVAASSRILAKLDEVPGDVVPISSAPSRRVARRRLMGAWPVRVAAGLLLMAGGAAVLTSNRTVWSPDSAPQLLSESADITDSAAPMAASALEEAPAASTAAPVASDAVASTQAANTLSPPNARPVMPGSRKAESAEATVGFSVAQTPPAPMPAPLRAAAKTTGAAAVGAVSGGAGADAASQAREERAAQDGARQRAALQTPPAVATAPAATAPEAITLSSATANAARHDSLAPSARVIAGWRLVSTTPIALEEAIVRRSVYEVRPGMTVTLDESAALPPRDAQAAVADLAARTRRAAAAAAPQAPKSAPPAAPLASSRADQSLAAESASALAPPAGMNVLRWRSASGTVMTLWGALGIVELEELRRRLD
jgi:anti-sigma factor RsiW